jgi:flagellar biosynthesis protein
MSGRTPRDYDLTDLVIALRYDGDGAPRVTASGRQELAERIRRLAREAGIPEYPDPELAEVLSQVPLGEEIPEALYLAVAQVIAFAFHVSGKLPPGFDQPGSP